MEDVCYTVCDIVFFSDLDVDCEEVYKMANVMSYCSGLKVMLHR